MIYRHVKRELQTIILSLADHQSSGLQELYTFGSSSPPYKREGIGTEMRPADVSGDAPISYWPIFSLSLVTVPEVFAKVNLAQLPSRF